MSKPIVILADLDESYLITLEFKFLKELNHAIELEVITDKGYFDEYFRNPRKADLLVVGDELYSQDLQKHNIGSLYVLTERMNQGGTEDLSVHKIYKYTSIREIFNELLSEGLAGVLTTESVKKETQVIALYSPIGGAGVPTLSVGLGAALARNHKKVCYLSTEALQSFQFYLSNKGCLSGEACNILKERNLHPYIQLKDYMRSEEFSYLPPLYASLSALGLTFDSYRTLIEDIRNSRDYDYVIVDMETGFHSEKTQLFGIVDKVMVILLQDAFSVHKAESLMRNLELKDGEKFLFVCNRFSREQKNWIVNSKLQNTAGISEYIGKLPLEEADHILKLEEFEEFQRLSYIFI